MNCFVIMISGNIYFSDVLMVFINIYYILWLILWFFIKIDFIKWKWMNKNGIEKRKVSMFWSLNVFYYLLFKIMYFYYKFVFF